jgi:hypothetical protein
VTRELSIQDVAGIMGRVPDLTGMMLVGGQALNYWAETLGIADAKSTGIYGPATSEDIDIMGSVKAVRAFAQAVGGKAHIAGFDDSHSPNSGVVIFDFQGETHSVDFLAQMAGFKPMELPAVLKRAVTGPLCSTSTAPLSVMHPMHCLQAQLENIYGAMLNRRASAYGERYVSRVRLAIEACRRIGQQCAEGGDIQKTRDIAEHVHTLSCLRSALRARHEDGLHVEEGIYTGEHMPQEFLNLRVPQMLRLLARKVQKYEELQKRIQTRRHKAR